MKLIFLTLISFSLFAMNSSTQENLIEELKQFGVTDTHLLESELSDAYELAQTKQGFKLGTISVCTKLKKKFNSKKRKMICLASKQKYILTIDESTSNLKFNEILEGAQFVVTYLHLADGIKEKSQYCFRGLKGNFDLGAPISAAITTEKSCSGAKIDKKALFIFVGLKFAFLDELNFVNFKLEAL